MELVVVQGDVLEFTFTPFDEETGKEYELQSGEKLFFMAGPFCTSGKCEIHIKQTSNYFCIDKVDLKPGTYNFDAGIIFANGTTLTLIDADEGKLKVKRRTGER